MTTELTTTGGAELVAGAPLDENAAAVYLAGLGAGSRRTMSQALDTIAGIIVSSGTADALTLPWHDLRFQHTAAIRGALAERYRPATTNKMLSALRGVLKTAWRLGQLDADSYRRAADLPSVNGTTLPAGRSLTSGEIAALLGTCGAEQGAKGIRDAALIGVLYSGLRRAEVVGLDLADWDAAGGTLRVLGKGSKERQVPVVNGGRLALADWLSIRGNEPGPLFLGIRKGGTVQRRRLSTQAVYHILSKRAEQAGIDALSPHDFRRTVAGDLLDAGADLVVVQKILGHASPTTTARYDRRPESAKASAMDRLHLPYQRRVLGDGN